MDFATRKKHYINEIQNIAKESFNKEQKKLAYDILNTATENNIDSLYTFITQRVKIGFVFDAAPEVAHNCISLCERDDKKSFGSPADNAVHHKLIIGENYDALKNLVATYTKNGHGMIDVIYIDPPYNTEKTKEDGNDYKTEVESSKFIYRDKFSRTGWLNMMSERLKLAKKLLSEKGVIFISIDDNEQAYLKVLGDEIFGENNFIGMLNCLDNLKGKENDSYLSYTSHYILIWAKQKTEDGAFNLVSTGTPLEEKYSKVDENGNIYTLNSFKKTGASKYREDRPSMFFPILYKNDALSLPSKEDYVSLYEQNEFNDLNLKKVKTKYQNLGYEFILPTDKDGKYLRWTSGFENCQKLIDLNQLEYNSGSISQRKYPKDIELIENSTYGTPKNFIYKKDFANGTIDLQKIGLEFSNPKSVALIKYLISLNPNNEASIILDFFAGSGTTGQAVMELNAKDGRSRQCILVTNNENNIATEVTYERLYRVINGKGTKGESFEWTYTKEQPYLINNYVDVFNVKSYELKIDDYEKSQKLLDKAKSEFKKLNPDYEAHEFDIYNQLASLKPYKPDEVK